MKVLQMGPIPPPQGGVQVHLMAIRAMLRQRGHAAYGINLTRHRQPDHDGLFSPHSPFQVLQRILQLRPDIIHLHIGGDLATRLLGLGAICSLLPRTKTVLSFHSGGYPTSPQGRRITSGTLKARLLRRFNRVIAVNSEIHEFLLRNCGVAPKCARMILPFASGRVGEGPLPKRLDTFFRSHGPLLATIGLLEDEYDLPLQIELIGDMVATHPNTGLLIVGSGSMQGELGRLIASKPWRDNILLYGDMDHPITLAALRQVDVFLRTTKYDGDSLSVREALGLGVPVVATKTVLRPAGVRLVDVGDRAAAHAAILQCLEQPRSKPDEQQAASGDENLEQILRLYEELVA